MSADNPWTTVTSREVYRNPWMRIREDEVIRPDGTPGIYGVVETHLAVGVVAVTGDAEIVLAGQYRYTTGSYSWEIVEGGVDPAEDPLTAGRRELEEEAGLVAATWRPLGGEIHLSNSITAERAYLYLAEHLTGTTSRPEGTEVLQIRTAPLAECLRMIDGGEVQDALTIMGLLMYDRMQREHGG